MNAFLIAFSLVMAACTGYAYGIGVRGPLRQMLAIATALLLAIALLTGCGKSLPRKTAGTSCRGYTVGAEAVDSRGNTLKCTATSTGNQWLIPRG